MENAVTIENVRINDFQRERVLSGYKAQGVALGEGRYGMMKQKVIRSEVKKLKGKKIGQITQRNGKIWVEWHTTNQILRCRMNEVLWKVCKIPT